MQEDHVWPLAQSRRLDVVPRALHLSIQERSDGSLRARSLRARSEVAEEELDCLACGVCCRQASDGRILVPEQDLIRWRRAGRLDLAAQVVPGHFGEVAFAYTEEGACVHLGTPASPNACSIYADRGTTCRDFERGSWQCLEFRRDAGLSSPR
jgi:Fe-S-cluster containining protein